MPEFKNAVPGNFCWIEIASTDPAAARKFYGTLFGWGVNDMPTPDGTPYAIADIGGKHVAGITRLADQAKKMGAPPHWLSYVAVENADATTKKAASLGGKVLMGPIQMGPGHMAVLQDPTGGVFAIWQALESMGTFLYGETGALAWNELTTTDVDRAGKFYSNLFGWKPEAQDMGGFVYTTFKNGTTQVGGMMAQPKEMAGAPSVWTVYFTVKDADASAAKATSLGAKPLTPLMDIPNVGRFGVLADPQGAAFAIFKPVPAAK